MKTLILDSIAGRLQWTSNRESYLEALARISHQHCDPRVVFHAGPLRAGQAL